jgi:hypothetical protein
VLYPDVPPIDHGVAHNALDDAIAQAKHALAIFANMHRESQTSSSLW